MAKLRNIILTAVVFATAWLLYANTLDNPFTYDDLVMIQGNEHLDEPASAKFLFSKQYFKISGERSYRPVSTGAFLLTAAAGGGREQPRAFRGASITAHALCCVAVFAFVLIISNRSAVAFTAALIFAAHPLHTEAVDAMSFIEDPLSAMFFFAAFALYALARRNRSWFAGALSLVPAALAMFAKESAAVLPVCILAYEWIMKPGGEGAGKKGGGKGLVIAHFAVAVVFAIIRFGIITHPSSSAAAAMPGGGAGPAFSFMAAAFLKYIWLFLFPYKLSVEHCINAGVPPAEYLVVISVLVYAGLLAFAVAAVRINRLMSFSVVFFLLNLLPISNIVPFGAVMAERYAYLPTFGLCLLLPLLFLDEKEERWVLGIKINSINVMFLVCMAGFLAMLTVERNRDWSSGLVLWEKAVAVCPESSRARTNYARRLIESDKYSMAAAQLKKAVEIHPSHHEAWTALGAALFHEGDYVNALNAYLRAYDLHPSNGVRYNIAILYLRTGKPEAAVPLLKEMISRQPDWPAAHYLLGNAYLRLGRLGEAEREYLDTLRLDPAFVDAMGNLGIVLKKTGRPEEARDIFNQILRAYPDNELARKNLDAIQDTINGKKEPVSE